MSLSRVSENGHGSLQALPLMHGTSRGRWPSCCSAPMATCPVGPKPRKHICTLVCVGQAGRLSPRHPAHKGAGRGLVAQLLAWSAAIDSGAHPLTMGTICRTDPSECVAE